MYKRDYRRVKKESDGSSIFSFFSLTALIIFVNVIIFIASLILVAFFGENVYSYLAIYPPNIVSGKYLWTLITHMFMHGGIFHLAFNMIVLYSLGGLTEKIIGRKRFFWFYMISGVAAGLLSAYLAFYFSQGFLEKIFGAPDIFMVGASGAIFAIAGLFVVLLPRIKFSIIFLPFFSLPGYVMVPLVLLLTWIFSIAGNLPVGNVAHFGGFLVGIIYGSYLRVKYKRKVNMLQKFFR